MLIKFYKYILKKNNDPYSVNLTLFVYNSDEINNLSSSQNIDKVFLKLFSEFLTYETSKHILLQIINVDIPMINLDEFLVSIPELKQLTDISNVQNKVVSIGITEHFFKMVNLAEYLTNSNKSDEVFSDVIFQVLHVLSVIQNKYSSFRHNNLHVKYMDGYAIGKPKQEKYMHDGNEYIVENQGFLYKMSNFERAIISDMLPNENIDNKICHVCNGHGIISVISGMPPVHTKNQQK